MAANRAPARWLLGVLLSVLASGLVGACYEEPVAITTWPPTYEPSSALPTRPAGQTPSAPVASLSPVPNASQPPEPATALPSGAPGAGCANGWITPAAGSREHAQALAILDEAMDTDGGWEILELRYFVGPDPLADVPAEARYWYLRAALADDPLFRGRWLLVARDEVDRAVAAVAPFDSSGFHSPDWTAFIGDGPPTTYLGLPGEWSGTPYDFVTGVDGTERPGLSAEVVDCLGDT